ncbi:MAG: FMN-binding protein [Phaeodactylibacter sp.]|nr:FMN-binding protein [Phaeodactylibacter sp.]MCB9293701.1 FMN-binding protein [Lewinellaceae bacterium]
MEITLEMEEKNIQPVMAQELETSSFRLISTLGLAGFFSGLVLVGAFLFTRPIIAANRAQALQEAIFKVLPGCASFRTIELREGRLVMVEEGAPEPREGEEVRRIYAGYNDKGKLIGFAITGEEPGYQDLIVAIFGYNPRKEVVVGFEVLESKETPGLGDKIMKDPAFLSNFRALAVEPPVKVVPKGEKKKDNEIEAITGATISSKAVGRLLEKSLIEWRPLIGEYWKEYKKEGD